MNRNQQPQADEVNQPNKKPFEFPEAMLLAANNGLAVHEFGDGKVALIAFTTTEVAAKSLERGLGVGPIDKTMVVKKVHPGRWSNIADSIGPMLTEVQVVYRIGAGTVSSWNVPIDVFLEVARRRCEAEAIRLYSQPNEETDGSDDPSQRPKEVDAICDR